MRSNLLGMCSAVAAVAMASSASAGVVIDAFTSSVIDQDRTSYGGFFNSRSSGVSGTFANYGIDTTNNRLTASVGASGFVVTTWENYDANGNVGPFVNLSQLSTITFDVYTANATQISFSIQQRTGDLDSSFGTGAVRWNSVAIGSGTSTITLTVGQNSGGAWSTYGTGMLALNNVSYMAMTLRSNFDGYVSNLQYNLVPAPGAAALVGLAGFVATRRRKA